MFVGNWDFCFRGTPATGRYDASTNYTIRDDEREAYRTGADVMPYNFGGKSLDDFITLHYPQGVKFDPAQYPQQ
jgi:hypothetical protein